MVLKMVFVSLRFLKLEIMGKTSFQLCAVVVLLSVDDGATRLISILNKSSKRREREEKLLLEAASVYLQVSQNLESNPTADTVKALLDNQFLVSSGNKIVLQPLFGFLG